MARPSYDDGDFGGDGARTAMRPVYPSLTPAVKWLLIANVAVWLVCFLLPEAAYAWVLHWLAIDPEAWRANAPLVPLWQLFSYGFLHSTSGVGHILMNMLVLYFFGLMLEQEFGSRRFLITYFASQIVGGACYLAIALPTDGQAPLLGASGGCFGVMVAAAVLWPRRTVILFIVPLTLRTFALIFVGIEVFSLLLTLKGAPSDGVSHVTHLGGIVYGFVAVRTGLIRWDPVRAFSERRVTRAVQSAAEDERRMDQLLEKIHREGMAALSRGEREFLKRVSSRR
jgi:membrane associated rhomboid family serine protease